MKLHVCGALGLSVLLPMAAMADFQYQETTQITGGSMLSMLKMNQGIREMPSQIVRSTHREALCRFKTHVSSIHVR